MGYLRDAVTGIGWMSLFRISYRVIGLTRIVILARLLAPNDFGVFGITTIVLGFLEIVTETGINVFLIQEKEKLSKFVNTAWVSSILRGFIIAVLIAISAHPISVFFDSPDSVSLLLLVALVPLIRGFINPSIVAQQKNLDFKKEFFYRGTVFFVEASFSVVLALVTHSAASLVYGLIVGAIFEVIYTFIVARPIPKLKFEFNIFKNIISRGKWVTGYGIFDYIYTQSDNIVVGKFLGPGALGIYDNAYTISTSPLTEVGDVFFRVTFPLFSKLSKNKVQLLDAFLKNIIVNALLMIPSGVVIFIFADPLVRILLGDGWLDAIPLVKLLSILGVVRGIANSTNSLLISLQKQKYSAIVTMVSALGLWIFLIPLVRNYGSMGAAMASIVGIIISIPFTVYFVNKALKSA